MTHVSTVTTKKRLAKGSIARKPTRHMRHSFASATICMAIILAMATTARAQSKINLAGIYELNTKVNGSAYQMYLELDFINQRPDFTQTFKEKTSTFKLLPEDFMNAKKLKQTFKGTKAPGFGRYREKYLLSLTEEFKITNPHLKKGVIIADWENDMNKTGKVVLLPNEDGSIVTYGLTDFDRELSPDGIRLELVKDLTTSNTGNKWTDGAKSGTATASFINEIKTSCGKDLSGTIQRLIRMPDDNGSAQPKGKPNTGKQSTQNNNTDIDIQLWGETEGILFRFHTIATGGDYGKFETNACLDFWQNDNGEISMRAYATTVYFNSGNQREYEYIYRGRRKGNKIIFTRRQDSLNGGDFVPLESWDPSVLTIKSPTTVEFDRCLYKKSKE